MSRHQSSTLERRRQPRAVPPTGRAARKKHGLLHRTGIVLPAAAIAAVLVTIVTLVSYLVSPNGSGAGNLSSALGGLQNSKSVTLLAKERQQIVVMNEAASTMTVAAKPVTVSPSQISAQEPQAPAPPTTSSSNTSSDSPASGMPSIDTTVTGAGPEEAQSIAKSMMSSFGFSPSTQWECLDEVWMKESSWEYDAENASGAYGIPQSLPASKMASAGPDYMTNAETQIKWGLGYIQDTYGTPCDAWAHEVNDGWY